MDARNTYPILITVNGRLINKVIIDSHYQTKHAQSITDDLIIDLVKKLDGNTFIPVAEKDGFQYFKAEPVMFNDKNYRLIWILEDHEIYIGVINAFRRD